MRPVRQRPRTIGWFALLFGAAALLNLASGLLDPATTQAMLGTRFPGIDWTRDMAIVTVSARFTIALIPIALVWFAASRFARWLVAAMTLIRLAGVPAVVEAWRMGIEPALGQPLALLLGLVGAAMLFTPSASRWFAKGADGEARVFE